MLQYTPTINFTRGVFMSGGTFDHDQYRLGYIADIIGDYIYHNNSQETLMNGYKRYSSFSDETISKFQDAVILLEIAQIYAQRIDYLLAGDDGEETFHERLDKELKTYGRIKDED